jgi:hypothetical protein
MSNINIIKEIESNVHLTNGANLVLYIISSLIVKQVIIITPIIKNKNSIYITNKMIHKQRKKINID